MVPTTHDVKVEVQYTDRVVPLNGREEQLVKRVCEKTVDFLKHRLVDTSGPAFQPFLFEGLAVEAMQRTSSRGLSRWTHHVRVVVDQP